MLAFKLGSRQKSQNALPLEYEPSFIGIFYLKLYYCFGSDRFFCFIPSERLLGFLEREFYIPIFVFFLDYFCFYSVSQAYFLDNVLGVYKLSSINDAGSVWGKIYENGRFIHQDYRSLYQSIEFRFLLDKSSVFVDLSPYGTGIIYG